jgi:cyclomaltodextrinase / maltogenic alpha-amylase / neopullulanase
MIHYLRRRALVAMLLSVALVGAAGAETAGAESHDYSRDQARSSPAWVHEGVIYQIFPRNFSASGDFNGVTAQLDRLAQLGVNILWLMPIHPVGKLKAKGTLGSSYAVRDYYGINPEYGTAADLHRLVGEAHKRKLKVIIDIVANHTAWDSVLMKHPEWYWHDSAGQIIPPEPDWADVAHLQYANAELRRYMTDMLEYWVKDFDLDGFRCDVAAGVPTDFWEQARAELAAIKPDIVMLAESEQPDLTAKAFDLDYSWNLYNAVSAAILGQGSATAVHEQWQKDAAHYEHGALRLRFSDNHDLDRAIARFGQPASLAAAALMFTLDGVPLIYNGMEVGDTAESGAPALFEKLPILWSIVERRPQYAQSISQLIALRRSHPALTAGDLSWVHNSNEAQVITFTRRSATETLLIAINLSNQPFVGVVEAGDASFAELTSATPGTTAAPGAAPQKRASGLPALSLRAWEYRVFRQQQSRPMS